MPMLSCYANLHHPQLRRLASAGEEYSSWQAASDYLKANGKKWGHRYASHDQSCHRKCLSVRCWRWSRFCEECIDGIQERNICESDFSTVPSALS